jgi:hypothetical protein
MDGFVRHVIEGDPGRSNRRRWHRRTAHRRGRGGVRARRTSGLRGCDDAQSDAGACLEVTMRTLTFGFLNLNILPAGNAPPLEVIDAAAAAGFRSAGLRISGRRIEDPCGPGRRQRSRHRRAARARARRAACERAQARGVRLSSITGYGFFPDVPLRRAGSRPGCGRRALEPTS